MEASSIDRLKMRGKYNPLKKSTDYDQFNKGYAPDLDFARGSGVAGKKG